MSQTWWGKVWQEKMERLAESKRFLEGTRYVAGKKVQRIRLEGRTIVALVQGANEPARTVRITFDGFNPEQWEQLFANVRDWPALAKAIERGELPLELQTAFSKAKLRFMPERYADLHIECGCADWLKPCNHLVAAWLRFGHEFEADPSLLFQLRGMSRALLFDTLRGREAVELQPAPVAEIEPEEDAEEDALPLQLQPLPADPEAFWAERALPSPPPDADGRRLLDLDMLEQLGPLPAQTDWRILETQLHRVYDAAYELASRVLKR
jgi:uncharacterized Zn finger protein